MARNGLRDVSHARLISSARRHARLNMWQEAVRCYASALSIRPHRAATWLQLGHCHKHLSANQAAEEAYRKAVFLAPADFEANRQLAFFLRTEGRDQEAQHYFACAYFLDPNDNEIDQILRYSGAVEQASEQLALSVFIAARPSQREPMGPADRLVTTIRRSRARKAARRGLWRAATDEYRAFLARDQNNSGIWLQLGHAEREQGNLSSAELAYRRAVALAPRNPDTLLHLGYALKDRGKMMSAILYLQECLRIAPRHAAAMEGLTALNAVMPEDNLTVAAQGRTPKHLGAVPLTWGEKASTLPPPLNVAPHLTPVVEAELEIFMLTVRRLTQGDLASNPS